ncbi:MAG: hypothetical protein AAF478_05140 [Pseudomonadota bacterium]
MSAIIKFPLEKVQRTSNKTRQAGQTAEILVFEGVQYVCDQQTKHSPGQVSRASRASKKNRS